MATRARDVGEKDEGVTIRVTSSGVDVEGERDPMRRAFYRWMGGVAARAVETAPADALEAAVSESSVRRGLLDLVGALPVADEPEAARLLDEALARGQRALEETVQRAGGLRSSSWVATHLGISRQAVDKRRNAGRLLGVRQPGGNWVYPAAQFSERGVVPGLEAALAAFAVDDPWLRLQALVGPSPALGGRSVLDVLRAATDAGERERALAVVAAYFAD